MVIDGPASTPRTGPEPAAPAPRSPEEARQAQARATLLGASFGLVAGVLLVALFTLGKRYMKRRTRASSKAAMAGTDVLPTSRPALHLYF